MTPRLHSCNATRELQSSMPLCLRVCTPTTRLPNSRTLYVHPSMSPDPQRPSRAAALHSFSASPEFHVSLTPWRYTCSESPDLHTSIPPRRYTFSSFQSSTPPNLLSPRLQRASRPPRPYGCSAHPELQSSMASYLHVAIPVVHFQISTPPSSILLRLHIAAHTARLQNFMLCIPLC